MAGTGPISDQLVHEGDAEAEEVGGLSGGHILLLLPWRAGERAEASDSGEGRTEVVRSVAQFVGR